MPTEIRTILFAREEVLEALRDFSRRKGEPLPKGTLFKYSLGSKPRLRVAIGLVEEGREEVSHHEFFSRDIGAALVAYCIRSKVPLPAKGATKALQVQGDSLALVITFGAAPEALDEHLKLNNNHG